MGQHLQKAPWIICEGCNGEGTRDTLGVINPHEWDEDELQGYFAGQYDKVCDVCEGSGKVRDEYPRKVTLYGPDAEPYTYTKYSEDDESYRENHAERMMGA
jgi:hypothetical protein